MPKHISPKNLSKVSVCMITYAHEKYIREAIEGVLMQECEFEVELIVANDCSPDATDQIIKEIIATHPRGKWINYFNHKENLGMMPNFIFALRQCKGEYIALCEGDDYWIDPLKLKKQVHFLENNPDFKFCITNLNFYNQSTQLKSLNIFDRRKLYLNIDDFLVNKAFAAPCTWVGKRECFFYTAFNENETDATFGMFLDILKQTKVYYLADTTAVYRILEESASNSNSPFYMYAYHKGLHKIQNHYIEKYNLIHLSEIVAEKHLKAIIKVLKNSSNFGQINQLLENIEEDLVYSHYTKVLKGVIGEYQKKFLAIENSTSMKIGIFFTTPILRIMKSLKFKA